MPFPEIFPSSFCLSGFNADVLYNNHISVTRGGLLQSHVGKT